MYQRSIKNNHYRPNLNEIGTSTLWRDCNPNHVLERVLGFCSKFDTILFTGFCSKFDTIWFRIWLRGRKCSGTIKTEAIFIRITFIVYDYMNSCFLPFLLVLIDSWYFLLMIHILIPFLSSAFIMNLVLPETCPYRVICFVTKLSLLLLVSTYLFLPDPSFLDPSRPFWITL